jgi:hypothetical protein
MKRKTCVALLALSSGLMMVFAANVDKCTEKFNGCMESCTNLKFQLKARGSTPEAVEMRYKECSQACNKALKDCQTKK